MEFRYEQREQLLHLIQSVDGFGAPWHSYLTFLLPSLLNGPLVPFAYFSIVWVFRPFRPGTPAFTLALWVLIYLVPLSFAVSKITNFIFPAFPALALLIPYVTEGLLRTRRFALVLSLCVSAALMAFVWAATYRQPNLRWLSLLAAGVAFGVTLVLLTKITFASKLVAASVLALTALAVFSLYAYRDVLDNIREPGDGPAQALARQAASQLETLVSKDSLVLTHSNTMDGSAYIYIMYWSGLEATDICHEPQPANSINRFRQWKNLYLISDEPLPPVPVAHLATGYLYALDGIPFEVWSPAAIRVCSQKTTFP